MNSQRHSPNRREKLERDHHEENDCRDDREIADKLSVPERGPAQLSVAHFALALAWDPTSTRNPIFMTAWASFK
jgi:hypothetical protein